MCTKHGSINCYKTKVLLFNTDKYYMKILAIVLLILTGCGSKEFQAEQAELCQDELECEMYCQEMHPGSSLDRKQCYSNELDRLFLLRNGSGAWFEPSTNLSTDGFFTFFDSLDQRIIVPASFAKPFLQTLHVFFTHRNPLCNI
jgi:hypothetical protein